MSKNWDIRLQSIYDTAKDLPDATCRRFTRWVVGQPVLAKRWLQVSGYLPVIALTNRILSGTLGDLMEEANRFVIPMTIYQIREIHVDNLAIGLAARRNDDATFNDRAALLRAHNNAMLAMLNGDDRADVGLLADCPDDNAVSVFIQSLAAPEHRALVSAYLADHPRDDMAALEYSYKTQLVANIRAVATMLDVTRHHVTADLTRQGLIRRYTAVNQQLDNPAAAVDQLLKMGTDTILVVPTISYYLGAAVELLQLDPAVVRTVVDDGRLGQALDAAALIVRLLNDCGTTNIEDDGHVQAALVAELHTIKRPMSIAEALTQAQSSFGAVLTRFNKDITFGESNVCLDGIRSSMVNAESIAALQDRMRAVSAAYKQAQSQLEPLLQSMQIQPFSDVIMRFIEFHRTLYTSSFESTSGEYAVAKEQ